MAIPAMTQTIKRRKTRDTSIDERKCWLYFTDGKIVDPRRCPDGNHAHNHWDLTDQPVPAGEPNTVCKCPPETRKQ